MMTVLIGDTEEAKMFLTNDQWLAFEFDSDFCQFLEEKYFEPGTPKNVEFETLTLPVEGGVSFWFRIKDTGDNRENLEKALSEFYGPVKDNIDAEIEKLQENAKQFAKNLDEGGDL